MTPPELDLVTSGHLGRPRTTTKAPLDNVRGVLDDLRHVHRHALDAAHQASAGGRAEVANYHVGRADALRDALDRVEQVLR